MVIGGFQKFSLSDFPGLISAILFTRGCGFRCPYCHNPELVDPSRFGSEVPLDEIRDFLRSRMGRLQGVVITGGEPTIHADLPELLAEIKGMGYAVKLDTNGTNPGTLRRLLKDRAVDYVAMDIKAPLARYAEVVRAPVRDDDLLQSIALILQSGTCHEFRTTFAESVLSAGDVLEIAELVKGCQRYCLQAFRGGKVLEDTLRSSEATSRAQLEEIARTLRGAGCPVEVR
jgi:pyruvate formate lyase activating enzyme